MQDDSTILIVDDNEINQTILKDVINHLGHKTLSAENGRVAIDMLKVQRADLILLDIMMPEMDGYEVLEYLKNDSLLRDIPVIIISSLDEMDSTIKCIEMGAADYLPRPINRTLLNARIGACLEKKSLQDQERDNRKQIEELLGTLQADLRLGSAMQRRFLTNEDETKRVFEDIGYKTAIFNKAPKTISGDFYYPKHIDKNAAGIFFADVCGHGISAALISMRILSIVDHLRSPLHHASEFIEMLNSDIYEIMPKGHFVAASYLILNRNGFIISNAAQPYAIVVNGNEIREIEIDNRPLGQDAASQYQDVTGDLAKGDKLILYTDGITEATNSNGDPYGEERFMAAIKDNLNSPVDELVKNIVSGLEEFAGNAAFDDDITICVFEKE